MKNENEEWRGPFRLCFIFIFHFSFFITRVSKSRVSPSRGAFPVRIATPDRSCARPEGQGSRNHSAFAIPVFRRFGVTRRSNRAGRLARAWPRRASVKQTVGRRLFRQTDANGGGQPALVVRAGDAI